MEPNNSLFQKWMRQEHGYTNFGSFQTTILQAYKLADLDNRKRLRIAFPAWFEGEKRANDPIYIENVLYVSAHAQPIIRYIKGLIRAHIQDERILPPEKEWSEWIKDNNF